MYGTKIQKDREPYILMTSSTFVISTIERSLRDQLLKYLRSATDYHLGKDRYLVPWALRGYELCKGVVPHLQSMKFGKIIVFQKIRTDILLFRLGHISSLNPALFFHWVWLGVGILIHCWRLCLQALINLNLH